MLQQATMASNEKTFGDAQPSHDEPQAGYPPRGYPSAGYSAYQLVSYPPPQTRYPPPQTGFPSAGAHLAHQFTTVVTGPGSSAVPGSTYNYKHRPALIICQHCQSTVTTSLHYEESYAACVLACFLCLCGCCLGCCLILFFMDSFIDAVHTCPKCGDIVGKYEKRLKRFF